MTATSAFLKSATYTVSVASFTATDRGSPPARLTTLEIVLVTPLMAVTLPFVSVTQTTSEDSSTATLFGSVPTPVSTVVVIVFLAPSMTVTWRDTGLATYTVLVALSTAIPPTATPIGSAT